MSIIEGILARCKAQDKQFTVTLENGETLTFRRLTDASEIVEMEKRAQQFAEAAMKRPSPAWKAFAPKTPEAGRMAFYISELAIEPTISQGEALELAFVGGGVATSLYGAIIKEVGVLAAQVEGQALDRLGES